ncbi:MAG: hypothetical protein MZV63_13575 [Marinilabiliales bacterium]|nr:hypothetical protein [Marinilabiliales bacterium]
MSCGAGSCLSPRPEATSPTRTSSPRSHEGLPRHQRLCRRCGHARPLCGRGARCPRSSRPHRLNGPCWRDRGRS